MASDDTKTVLNEASAAAVRMMLAKLADHDVTEVYEVVGGTGPIDDLAADDMRDRNEGL